MLARMPHRVFRQWRQLYEEEPFGVEADGIRLGYAAAALAGVWGKPKGRRGWRPKDFMPEFAFKKHVETPDEQVERLKAITLMMGGTVIDKRKDAKSD